MPNAKLDQLRSCSAFLIDLDGTMYIGDKRVAGAAELFRLLASTNRSYLFLTNNSSAGKNEYRNHLASLGINTTSDRILTSGEATITYLLRNTTYRSVYLLGTPALEEAFRSSGFILDGDEPDCVVVGFDKTFTYAKLKKACCFLFNGKPYFATHPDRTCITAEGLIPDIAALIAAIKAITDRVPKVIGKPEREIVEIALARLNATAVTTAIIGDQLDTDMVMARKSGTSGVLVLSGETSAEMLQGVPRNKRTFLVAESVAEVAEWLKGTS
jgi:HAD superfamily hydrolase (TIGR01450 family)